VTRLPTRNAAATIRVSQTSAKHFRGEPSPLAHLPHILDATSVTFVTTDIANNTRSLSDFKRNTSELLDRLKKTGNPLVLTIKGKAEVVVQDAEAYRSCSNA
jgi:prevent-host-death family protein